MQGIPWQVCFLIMSLRYNKWYTNMEGRKNELMCILCAITPLWLNHICVYIVYKVILLITITSHLYHCYITDQTLNQCWFNVSIVVRFVLYYCVLFCSSFVVSCETCTSFWTNHKCIQTGENFLVVLKFRYMSNELINCLYGRNTCHIGLFANIKFHAMCSVRNVKILRTNYCLRNNRKFNFIRIVVTWSIFYWINCIIIIATISMILYEV